MYTIIAMLAIFVAMPVPYTFAVGDATEWDNWGSSPFAHSRKEACQKAVTAISGFNMTGPVKNHFKSLLENTKECEFGGTELWLTPRKVFVEMWSGPFGKKSAHVMTNKVVAELPVTTSPKGRSYRQGAVAEAAKAAMWEFVYEGKKYTLYLPFVCFNWSWAVEESSQEDCYTVIVPILSPEWRATKMYWGVATVDGMPLPPSVCNAQKVDRGDGWLMWSGVCEECSLINYSDLKNFIGDSVGVPHKFVYSVPSSATLLTLRFSAAVRKAAVYICLKGKIMADGEEGESETCGVYVRPDDWAEGRVQVEIPPSLFIWDTTQCPTQE